MTYVDYGMPNSNEQEQISGTYHKRDRFHRHNVEGKKPGTKEYHYLISFLSKTGKITLWG